MGGNKGLTNAKNMVNPMTKRFLEELRSTNWRLESPTEAIMPNITQKMPPTIGLGMVRKNDPVSNKNNEIKEIKLIL